MNFDFSFALRLQLGLCTRLAALPPDVRWRLCPTRIAPKSTRGYARKRYIVKWGRSPVTRLC